MSLQDLRQLEDYELEKEKREKKRRNERDGDRERSKGRSEEQRSVRPLILDCYISGEYFINPLLTLIVPQTISVALGRG